MQLQRVGQDAASEQQLHKGGKKKQQEKDSLFKNSVVKIGQLYAKGSNWTTLSNHAQK